MASASEIKTRINGIRDTKKITDAMYMISSAKMRKALRELEQSTPYFEALGTKIGELVLALPELDSPYFAAPDTNSPNRAILLITSDKGLAGSYNLTAVHACEKALAVSQKSTLFIIGEYGRQYFTEKRIPFEREFCYSMERPQMIDAQRICAELLTYYNEQRLDEICIIYTDYNGNRASECKTVELLPLRKTSFGVAASSQSVKREFLPTPREVIDGVIPSYLAGFIYGSLVESFCSEQAARMQAMKSSSDNAEKMLRKLKQEYNEKRQAAITNEMIEISSGAKALKAKRKKRQEGKV